MNLREIDRLVAEHVMGWAEIAYVVGGYGDGRNNTEEGPWYEWQGCRNKSSLPTRISYYSSNIAAAWEVVEKLVSEGLRVDLMAAPAGQFCVWIDGTALEGDYLADEIVAETVPLTICLAALKAKGIEVPK